MFHNAVIVFLVMALGGTAQGEGAEINLDIRTPLCRAVESEDMEKVFALVENAADVNRACSFTKAEYPILVAARTGNAHIGELLLAKGADVNQAGFLQYTPLLRAGEGLHPTFVGLLLQNGADVTDKLIDLPGLNLNIGLDVVSLTTAAYLRKSLIAPQSEQGALDKDYAAILDLLFKQCFNFEKFGGLSKTRLESEGHPVEAALITKYAKAKQPSC